MVITEGYLKNNWTTLLLGGFLCVPLGNLTERLSSLLLCTAGCVSLFCEMNPKNCFIYRYYLNHKH